MCGAFWSLGRLGFKASGLGLQSWIEGYGLGWSTVQGFNLGFRAYGLGVRWCLGFVFVSSMSKRSKCANKVSWASGLWGFRVCAKRSSILLPFMLPVEALTVSGSMVYRTYMDLSNLKTLNPKPLNPKP